MNRTNFLFDLQLVLLGPLTAIHKLKLSEQNRVSSALHCTVEALIMAATRLAAPVEPFALVCPPTMERSGSTCESFLSNDGSDDLVVRYQWHGEAIGLELMRAAPSAAVHTVHWGAEPLGVTLGVEETSRRVIVTRSSRADVQVGDVLLQARGEPVTEQNFAQRMAALKQERELCPGIPFVFAPPPPPVCVKKCAGALREAGVDASFELRYVDGRVVRYLEMKELQVLIRNSRKPCSMAFVQSKERQFYGVLQRQEQQRRKQQQVSQAAPASAGLALAAAFVVNIT
ncbi:unnamed protein product [Phytophthora lilii]|uniref:Unnamed protein product n=1 Tax=Phytophthora lilii TaxID=2077276 RepID=A0A9W6U8Y1_9STRA|nr:unnamed protein product [Phytophthora lilii]